MMTILGAPFKDIVDGDAIEKKLATNHDTDVQTLVAPYGSNSRSPLAARTRLDSSKASILIHRTANND